MTDEYEIYATCILITSIVSICFELYDIRKNLKNLKNMAYYECQVQVKRIDEQGNPIYRRISSNDLVPGDIMLVPENTKMPCDAIQLTGSSIVNEAMLTGESIPVIKNPLPNISHERYDPEEDKNYTLFSGTEVIQNRSLGQKEVTAIVIRTNFNTLKGSLIKSILYPKPNRFSFHADSMKFIGVLAIIALGGFFVTLPTSLKELSRKEMIYKALDLITITVPPALPAAMSIGVVFAMSRLRKDQIFCIDPKRINVAGRVKTMVFDKTGTLTEDSLQFSKLVVANKESFETECTSSEELVKPTSEDNKDIGQEHLKSKCLECMVTCHAIARVKGTFIGDPLDIEMFEATKWSIDEEPESKIEGLTELVSFHQSKDNEERKTQESKPLKLGQMEKGSSIYRMNASSVKNDEIELSTHSYHTGKGSLGIVKRFEFSSALQRMSVLTLNHSNFEMTAFVKGSPEMIHSLSNSESVPEDFFEVLEKYTQDGLRVLAMGYRTLQNFEVDWVKSCKREEIEQDLTFIGFLIMENKIKPETNPSLEKLQKANIDTIMATGDNGLTAVAVGRK
jgi:cation-transporting ATPase 13A3/4/5